MNKKEFTAAFAEDRGLTAKDAASLWEGIGAFLSGLLLTPGNAVQIGPFKIKNVERAARGERIGRDIRSGKEVTIPPKPASAQVKLTVSKAYREEVETAFAAAQKAAKKGAKGTKAAPAPAPNGKQSKAAPAPAPAPKGKGGKQSKPAPAPAPAPKNGKKQAPAPSTAKSGKAAPAKGGKR